MTAMRATLPAIVVVAALGLMAACAAAGEPSPDARPARAQSRNPIDRSYADPGAATFASFDIDRDGYISRDEALASAELTRQFSALDKDRDGKLSMRELTGWRHRAYTTTSGKSAEGSKKQEQAKQR
jgi:hypothetical protein